MLISTRNKDIWRKMVSFLLLLFPGFLFLSGCSSYQEMVIDAYKDNPSYYKNVKPQKPLAIDGLWKNPYNGYNYRMDRGRFFLLDQTSSTLPGFHMVTVRDIQRVASGRYRGTDFKKIKKATFSIVTEKRLLERHFIDGKPIDCVYDKVSVQDEEWFMNEYRTFLNDIKK